MPNPEPTLAEICKTRKTCPECGSDKISLVPHIHSTSGVVDGRLRMNEMALDFVLSCDHCSETIAVLTEKQVLPDGDILALVQAAEQRDGLQTDLARARIDTDHAVTIALAHEKANLELRIKLVQAAEQGEKYEKALEAVKAMLPHLGSIQGRALAWGTKMLPTHDAIVEVIDQALSSESPPSIRVTLGGTTNPNEAARGGSST